MKKLTLFLFLFSCLSVAAQKINFDADWQFAFGHAADPQKDFGCGTEYFNYLTKAASIHNEGPYSEKFDATKWGNEWKSVTLPHDWVVDLGFSGEASHSHGYKQVGWKWQETSVGWYRKVFDIKHNSDKETMHYVLTFDGIFRNSQVWVNGFYLGGEQSGYVSHDYDITDYLNFDKPNVVAVRVDASLEEGWFYEGAGIYRHVWLEVMNPVHIATDGVFAHTTFPDKEYKTAAVSVSAEVVNDSHEKAEVSVRASLFDGETVVASQTLHHIAGKEQKASLLPRARAEFGGVALTVENPNLWSLETPYLYILRTEVMRDGEVVDVRDTKIGLRDIMFDADKGFFLNGKHVKLHGVCMHQDHAGVGASIPDGVQVYRLEQLKKIGVNAYRSSHNPMTPETVAACDSLGILVIEENRLTGINDYQIGQLEKMIRRDRNHPSIIAWSMGNEEWGIEWSKFGEDILRTMVEYSHQIDPTRPATVATSSGPAPILYADLAGYNYIMQNDVENRRTQFPNRKAYGSEETTGCGTRGYYFQKEGDNGHMISLNRQPEVERDNCINRIERGWKFYAEHDWAAGCFFWTGFDYRGEPNPLSFPATGSEFGILDYCGFPKDEAYYLKAWWTDEPVLHILPHWNLHGHEGEEIDVWAYSNCDEVELFVNGKSLGKKKMEKNGHLAWRAIYKPGRVKAVGYKNGRRIMTETIETTGEAVSLKTEESVYGDVTVIDIFAQDKRGRFVPDALHIINIYSDGEILGVGNGDPAWQGKERPVAGEDKHSFQVPLFNGCAQVIVKDNSNTKISFQE